MALMMAVNQWRTNMTSITVKTGREGPRHDPYHYEEVTVERLDGRKVTLHRGLAVWADARWPNGHQCTTEGEAESAELFEMIVGVTVRSLERAVHKAHERKFTRHPCGMSHMKDVNGYPGETLTVCGKCGAVIDTDFDRSAVE